MTCDQTLLQSLRLQGYRITPQREMIVEALAHDDSHMTADQVYAQVKLRARSINLATVYRTLDLLVTSGLASRALLEDGQQVFATSDHGSHLHLVCRFCGRVEKVAHTAFLPMVAQLKSQTGFEVDCQHISLLGTCQSCQKK